MQLRGCYCLNGDIQGLVKSGLGFNAQQKRAEAGFYFIFFSGVYEIVLKMQEEGVTFFHAFLCLFPLNESEFAGVRQFPDKFTT